MKTFDSFYNELISDQRWFELLRHYRNETIFKAVEKVYAQLLADNIVDVRPMSENRKHVYNILYKNPGDKLVFKNWAAKALEIQEAEKEKEWIPVTGEERAKRLKEWEAIVKGSTMANSMPKPSYKQLAEEGGILPPKPAPYPSTSLKEWYVKERHLAWITASFEPRTKEKLPGYVDEETFNRIFDENHLTDKGL